MDKIYDYDANTDDVSTLMNCVKYVRSMDQMLECGFSYDKDDKGKCSAQCVKTEKSIGRTFLYSSENGLFLR